MKEIIFDYPEIKKTVQLEEDDEGNPKQMSVYNSVDVGQN